MWIAELWRYPVKSMAGERLAEATLGENGITGDRIVQVLGPRGRIVTARTDSWLLGHRAVLGADGEPVIDGRPWRQLRLPEGYQLRRYEGVDRFDVLPLLVATDGAIAAFGRDGRRLRPNIVIGGVEGLAERTWEKRALRVGETLVGIEKLRQRCVMTTYDPDTLAQDVGVLRDIVARFDGRLALNCWVVRGGTVRVGDRVELAG